MCWSPTLTLVGVRFVRKPTFSLAVAGASTSWTSYNTQHWQE